MPHKTGALLDPAAAIAFIEGYKRFLLTAATWTSSWRRWPPGNPRRRTQPNHEGPGPPQRHARKGQDTYARSGRPGSAGDWDPSGRKLDISQGYEELRSLHGFNWRVRLRSPRSHATDSRRRRDIRRIARDRNHSLSRPICMRRFGERRCSPRPQLSTELR